MLHGIQLRCALPEATRHMPPVVEHFVPEGSADGDARIRVFVGGLAGTSSPVRTSSPPLLGAEILLPAGGEVDLELDPTFEHGVLLDSGSLTLDEADLPIAHLAHLPVGRTTLRLRAGPSGARLLLIGGTPLGERIVVWWNSIGRDHEEIERYRATWQREIEFPGPAVPVLGNHPTGQLAPSPAPPLPHVRLRPRG